MLRDFRKNKLFNRRIAIMGGVQVGLISILIARLSFLQIFKYKEYSTKSDRNRIRPLVSPAQRGLIVDRNGVELTTNHNNYRLLLYFESKPDTKKLIEQLAEIMALSATEIDTMRGRVENSKGKKIISLIDNLTWDSVSRIETNYHKLNAVDIESGVLRAYIMPFATAHIIGYVSLPSEKESSGEEPQLFLHPDFRIGKNGLEKSFDEYLRGKFSVRYVEVNARGIPLRTLSKTQSVPGNGLKLTISAELQNFVSKRIEGLSASVVVMNVKTGEILSIVSSPSFDPNKFVEGVSHKYWNELASDPKKPLTNKTISATYPPGSTFKLMTAIAALESDIDPKREVFCDGTHRLGNRTFHCWEKRGHGKMNMSDAIKNSCNIYFYDISYQIGIEKITEIAKRFGYGEDLDISLYGSRSGNVPSDAWKRKVYHVPWVGGDTLNTSIGQGFLLASPLQMAVVTARIANGGVPIKPHLIKNKDTHSQYDELKGKPLANRKHIDLVLEGMRRVVNEKGGTAYGKRIDIKGFEMSGKTGTSQVVSKREDEMSDEEAENYKNHAIFVGLAPVSNPKYAISVVVEHGGGGSRTAAPIGKDIMIKVQELNV
ncbi:MAG: penicillin-binding protein 2 [Rickettsiales bacterium]|jgi:penicillin-binding protein 2